MNRIPQKLLWLVDAFLLSASNTPVNIGGDEVIVRWLEFDSALEAYGTEREL